MEYSNLENWNFFIILLIVLIVLILGIKKKNRILEMINLKKLNQKRYFNVILMSLGIFFIIFSLLGPQVFKRNKEVEKKGLDIYVCIDVSKSMLTEDIKPNRLLRAKESIQKLIDNLKGDRIAFLPFASSAYIQMPLTDDYDLGKMFLNVIDTNMMSGGGSNLESALDLANKSLEKASQGDKVILIFSDGEQHNKKAEEKAKELKEVSLYAIGIGTANGGLIPELNRDGQKIGWIKNNAGNVVTSRLHMENLKKITEITNGKIYVSTIAGDEISKIVNDILKLKRQKSKVEKVKVYMKLYQYFLGIGLVLFLLGYRYKWGFKK